MPMPLCYQYTHPTVALILQYVTQRPRGVRELTDELGLTLTHIRDTCLWMHKRKLIRVEMWLFGSPRGGPAIRVFGPGSAPDAVKPKSRRKRRRAAARKPPKRPPLIPVPETSST